MQGHDSVSRRITDNLNQDAVWRLGLDGIRARRSKSRDPDNVFSCRYHGQIGALQKWNFAVNQQSSLPSDGSGRHSGPPAPSNG